MGCGSILGDLFYLTDSLLEDPRSQLPPQIDYRGGEQGLQAQLYRMYGEGVISEEVFNVLRLLADKGKLRPADLAVHQVNATQPINRKTDSEVHNAIRGVRSRLAQLAETRSNSEKVLKELETRLTKLDNEVDTKEQNARQAVGKNNEDTARQRLTEKADLAGSHSRLAAQAEALREDLIRLNHLRIQLETKAAELEAVRAREELSKINNI